MEKKKKKSMSAFFVMLWAAAAATAQTGNASQADGKGVIELSTRDQNTPGLFLGLPETIAHLDRPRGGVIIYLMPDHRIVLELRMQICIQDMYARDVNCTRPPDFYFDGRLQEVGSVVDRGLLRTLYDIVIDAGTLHTGLVITDQGDYFLVVPRDTEMSSYQRVKLFVSVEE